MVELGYQTSKVKWKVCLLRDLPKSSELHLRGRALTRVMDIFSAGNFDSEFSDKMDCRQQQTSQAGTTTHKDNKHISVTGGEVN